MSLISGNYNYRGPIRPFGPPPCRNINDSTISTGSVSQAGSLGTTSCGAAVGAFAECLKEPPRPPRIDNLGLQKQPPNISDVLDASKMNGFSYNSNFIAASYVGFHPGATEPADAKLAQNSKAGLVEAVSRYDMAQKELDNLTKVENRMRTLENMIKQAKNSNSKSSKLNVKSLKDELAKLHEQFPDIRNAKAGAEQILNVAKENLNQAQNNYKLAFGDYADVDAVRNAINTTLIGMPEAEKQDNRLNQILHKGYGEIYPA